MSKEGRPEPLRKEDKLTRPPQKFDAPGCCSQAVLLVEWMPKSRSSGPPREGWCTMIESGGPNMRNRYYLVFYCPFCGSKLTNKSPVRKQ